MYKEATNRNFPHKTYGESKRLRSTYILKIRAIFSISIQEIFFCLYEGFREKEVC